MGLLDVHALYWRGAEAASRGLPYTDMAHTSFPMPEQAFMRVILPILLSCLVVLSAHSAVVAQPPDEPDAVSGEAVLVTEMEDVSGPDEAVDSTVEERMALMAHVDGLIAAHQREHGLGAITLSVVRDDGLWLARGWGLADIESEREVVPEETLFRIGSVSKTFTWTAVMMLAERGQLDLDADVNDYLPDFRVREAFGEPVTLRQIMHHRAGFEDTLRLFAVADDEPRALAELLAEHQPERVHPPGQRTSYSNWASALAAQVVENVARVSYGEFLQTEILDPLGMQDTTALAPAAMDEDLRARLATGYRPEQGALVGQDFMQIGPYWPAGGMASTATDMARWMRFHLNGGELDGVRLLEADGHGRMWTRAFDDRPEAADVAHGFQDRPYRGLQTFGHAGGTAAYLTNMVLVPELSLGVFLSQNSTHTASPIRQVPDLVIDHVAGFEYRPWLIDRDETGAEALAELAGTYFNNRRVFSTFTAVLGAFNTASVTPLSGESLAVNMAGETQYMRHLQGDVFVGAGGDHIAFVRDDDGRVVALADAMGVHSYERVGWFDNPLTLLTAFAAVVLLTLTHAAGFSRRVGRNVYSGFAARVAGSAALVAVLAVFVFAVALVYLAMGLGEFDVSRMAEEYPPAAMFIVHYAGWAVAVAAGVMVLAHWPAWSGSGWGLFKRLHFGLFTLALVFLSVQLWQWRVIGAPVI